MNNWIVLPWWQMEWETQIDATRKHIADNPELAEEKVLARGEDETGAIVDIYVLYWRSSRRYTNYAHYRYAKRLGIRVSAPFRHSWTNYFDEIQGHW